MALNYPLNPDTSFESWFLTNETEVIGDLGKSYNQNELVPINYARLMDAYIQGDIAYIPVREFVYISPAFDFNDINDEASNLNQSTAYGECLYQAYNYWKDRLLAELNIVGGIVTEMKTTILQDTTTIAPSNCFQIQTTLKINWLVVAEKNPYA
jgi:hypothetical protein